MGNRGMGLSILLDEQPRRRVFRFCSTVNRRIEFIDFDAYVPFITWRSREIVPDPPLIPAGSGRREAPFIPAGSNRREISAVQRVIQQKDSKPHGNCRRFSCPSLWLGDRSTGCNLASFHPILIGRSCSQAFSNSFPRPTRYELPDTVEAGC